MDRINIGMKAEMAVEMGAELQRKGQEARDAAGDDGVAAQFEVEFYTVKDNDTGKALTLAFNNDDMEREGVEKQEMYVELD